MRLARVDAFGGATVVVELNGRAFRTRHDSLRGALSAGVLSNPDPHLIEEVPVPRPADLLPVADATSKVICVGHNYREHILEMGHALPDYPNVFSKFPEALIGPAAAVALDQAAEAWDWEAELVFVIGRPARRVAVRDAAAHIAGYSVANDISARDWQRRGTQWLLGKTFEGTTPVGPWLVPASEVDPSEGLTVTCTVDGVEKQRASTSDLVFSPAALVSYLSTVLTLNVGDIILTGTPGGVGAARTPVERLEPGNVVVTQISGLGVLTNTCVAVEGI